jgi:flagellar biosynthesis chaperone FliJ
MSDHAKPLKHSYYNLKKSRVDRSLNETTATKILSDTKYIAVDDITITDDVMAIENVEKLINVLSERIEDHKNQTHKLSQKRINESAIEKETDSNLSTFYDLPSSLSDTKKLIEKLDSNISDAKEFISNEIRDDKDPIKESLSKIEKLNKHFTSLMDESKQLETSVVSKSPSHEKKISFANDFMKECLKIIDNEPDTLKRARKSILKTSSANDLNAKPADGKSNANESDTSAFLNSSIGLDKILKEIKDVLE